MLPLKAMEQRKSFRWVDKQVYNKEEFLKGVSLEQRGMEEMSAEFVAVKKTISGDQDAGGEIYIPEEYVKHATVSAAEGKPV